MGKLHFLFAHSRPELNSLQGYSIIRVLHSYDGELAENKPMRNRRTSKRAHPEQCLLHVEGHLVVIESHDPHQALKCTNLDISITVLSSFAYNLHDIVALALTYSVR